MKTQTIQSRIGRRYVIEHNDKLYSQRSTNDNLHYQLKNLQFAAGVCLTKGQPGTVVDVGMNVGLNTVEYATFAKRVVGFEPTVDVYNMAQQNIDYNTKNYDDTLIYMFDWSRKMTAQVETHCVALSNTTGQTEMFSHPRNNGLNHIIVKPTNSLKTRYTVQTRELDSYALSDVDFIKIDTEGHELWVCEGAKHTIDTQRPVLQLEVMPQQCKRAGYDWEDIWQFFVQRDYRVFSHNGVERTTGMTLAEHISKSGKRSKKLYHNGENINRMMDYFFIPSEHPYCADPKSVEHWRKQWMKK